MHMLHAHAWFDQNEVAIMHALRSALVHGPIPQLVLKHQPFCSCMCPAGVLADEMVSDALY